MDSTQTPLSCFTCHKVQAELTNTLKRCAKCQGALYCSRKCQTDDWKKHKRSCFSQAPSASPQPSAPPNSRGPTGQPLNPQRPTGQHNAGFSAVNHLLGLTNDDYLHALPEKEAFAQLIDCFRMRMEDEYTYGQNNIGIYAEESPVPVFKRFLDLAESRPGLLPPWWNAAKRRECETMAVDSNGWSDINCAIEKSDIQEHYDNNSMPMMLRVLGEKVYGRGFMWKVQSGGLLELDLGWLVWTRGEEKTPIFVNPCIFHIFGIFYNHYYLSYSTIFEPIISIWISVDLIYTWWCSITQTPRFKHELSQE